MNFSSKTKKVVVASIFCAIPFGLFAHDKYENKAGYFNEEDDNEIEYVMQREFYEKKGVNYVFEGRLQAKPKNKLSGIWKISDKSITVNDKTMIIQSDKKFEVGDEIFIAAKRQGDKIVAIELEQDD